MELVWVCAKGSRPEHLVNIRSSPDTGSELNIVGKLYTIGTKARYIGKVQDTVGKTWNKFFFLFNQTEGYVREDVHKVFSLNERKILDVDWIGQSDEDSNLANRECGLVCGLMLMRYGGFKQSKTVDDLVREVGLGRDEWTKFNHIILLLNKYGYKPVFQKPFLLTDVLDKIKQNVPVICLINYNQIFKDKFFAHFVVACGYDQEFVYCQDPLNNVQYINYSLQTFSKALANVGQMLDNQPYQTLYINYTEEQINQKTTDLFQRVEDLEKEIITLKSRIEKLEGAV